MKDVKNKLPVLSYSKISTFKRCPKCYKFAYVDKLPKKEHAYNLIGLLCHDVLENFHKYFLTNEIDSTKFREVMAASFKEVYKKYKLKMEKENIDESYDIIKFYLKKMFTDEFPNVTSVEEKIWETVDDKFIFYGFIDRVQKDKDGILHIVDYKTTKNKQYLKDDTQTKLYAYFCSKKYNLSIDDKIRTSYILLKHKCETVTKLYNVKELHKTKDKFVEQHELLSQEKLFRAVPRFDNCTICDYVEHCVEGKRLQQSKKAFIGKEDAW